MDAKNGKPSLFLTTGYELFLGNPGQEPVVLCGSELCGFNIGSFEQKIVTGRCWVVGDDRGQCL